MAFGETEMSKMLFLLGGHDLEMLTIRDILERHDVAYVDHRLSWDNACVSSYRKEIEEATKQGLMVCGIELQEDMPLPSSYRKIDHHNELAQLSTALEQVMDILHLPMDRHLRLVAANDKAYIPGMEQLGATKDEVNAIRRADRKAQGVTDEDERLAEQAIAQNRECIGDLQVVHALSPHFSPISDRLFPYQRLLIYTDDEWVYYGKDASRVRKWFVDEERRKDIYYGGGVDGYVGLKRGSCSVKEIDRMVKQIMKWSAYSYYSVSLFLYSKGNALLSH